MSRYAHLEPGDICRVDKSGAYGKFLRYEPGGFCILRLDLLNVEMRFKRGKLHKKLLSEEEKQLKSGIILT